MVASPVMVRTEQQSAAERAKSAAKRTSTQARCLLVATPSLRKSSAEGTSCCAGVDMVSRFRSFDTTPARSTTRTTTSSTQASTAARYRSPASCPHSRRRPRLLVAHHAGSSFGDHRRRAESLRDAFWHSPSQSRAEAKLSSRGSAARQPKTSSATTGSDARPQGCRAGLSHTVVARPHPFSFSSDGMKHCVAVTNLRPDGEPDSSRCTADARRRHRL